LVFWRIDRDPCFDAPWVVKQKIWIFAATRPDASFDVPRVVKGSIRTKIKIHLDVSFDDPRDIEAKKPIFAEIF